MKREQKSTWQEVRRSQKYSLKVYHRKGGNASGNRTLW